MKRTNGYQCKKIDKRPCEKHRRTKNWLEFTHSYPMKWFFMSNFANQLKSEIGRIAKKEIRSETSALKKSNSQYRSEIASLKRRLLALESSFKKYQKITPKSVETSKSEMAESLRFRVSGFANLRKKLGVTANEMGKLLGVSGQSIYKWEQGKAKPRSSQLKAIAAVRKMGKREVSAILSQ